MNPTTDTSNDHRNMLQFSIINLIKEVKTPLSVADLEERMKVPACTFRDDAILMRRLRENDNLLWRNNKVCLRKKYDFQDVEGLIKYMEEQPSKSIMSDFDFHQAWENIEKDVDQLHNEKKVLYVQQMSKRDCKTIYLNNIDGNVEYVSEKLIKMFCQVDVSMDNETIRSYLTSKSISLADISLDVVGRLFSAKKRKRRGGSSKSRKKRKENEHLATIEGPAVFVGVQVESDDEEEEYNDSDNEEGQTQILINENLKLMAKSVMRSFFSDEYVILFDALLREDSVQKKLVKEISSKTFKDNTTFERNRQNSLWYVDFREFIDIINFRIAKTDEEIEKLTQLEEEVSFCTNELCGHIYVKSDILRISTAVKCLICHKGEIKSLNTKDKAKSNQEIQKTLRSEIEPFRDVLKRVNQDGLDANLNIIRVTDETQIPKTQKKRRNQSQRNQRMERDRKRKELEKNIQAKIVNQVYDDYKPIEFVHTQDGIEVNIGLKNKTASSWGMCLQFAHDFLITVAEIKYYYSRVFGFEFTPNSIYLARLRGLTAEYILNILLMLSKSAIPQQLVDLIQKYQTEDYYKVMIVIKLDKFWVTSKDPIAIHRFKNFCCSQEGLKESADGSLLYEIRQQDVLQIKQFGRDIGEPILDEWDYLNDYSCDVVKMTVNTTPRDYQQLCVHKLFWNNRIHSGILVMPCGSGKTLVGVSIACTLKRRTLVFCTNTLAAAQWAEQFYKWTNIPKKLVTLFTSDNQRKWDPNALVVIATYKLFTLDADRRSKHTTALISQFQEHLWGLMILDEVHLAPAKTFRRVTTEFRSQCKVGLTATMVREDDLVQDLPFLVGPRYVEVDILDLIKRDYLAKVHCVEVVCPMTDKFSRAFMRAVSGNERRLLFVCNPNKGRVLVSILNHHLKLGHKVLVFCDDLFGLAWYSKVLKDPVTGKEKPYIDGKTVSDTRAAILKEFTEAKNGTFVLFSTVGDHSIDLPQAEVVIQLCVVDGGRMQEAQRVGRVQRPYAGKLNAWFYSVVSDNTEEVGYAHKRRGYMEEHGYRYEDLKFEDHVSKESAEMLDDHLQDGVLEAIKNELTQREQEKTKSAANKNDTSQQIVPIRPKKIGTAFDRLQKILKK